MKHTYIMNPRRVGFFAGVLAVLLTSFAHAADKATTTVVGTDSISLVGRPNANQIQLRWATNSARSWQLATRYGYYVERRVIQRDGSSVTASFTRLNALPLLPADSAVWQPYLRPANPDSVYFRVMYEVLYRKVPTSKGINSRIIYGQDEIFQRYMAVAMTSGLNYAAAKLMAWGYTDTNVKVNERYEYRIATGIPADSLQLVSTTYQVGQSDYRTLPVPPKPVLNFQPQLVNLSWAADPALTGFKSYFIYRSTDGINYQLRNQRPHIQAAPGQPQVFYQDDVPKGRKTYYYKIKGRTIFDEESFSPVAVGQSKDTVLSIPRIKDARLLDGSRARISWQFPGDSLIAGADTLLKGFAVAVANKPDDRPVLVAVNISPKDTAVTISNYLGKVRTTASLYFTVLALTLSGDTLQSTPVFTEPLDSLPPVAPIGLTGIINSQGIATISWQPNAEADLRGYKVFRYQNPAEKEPSAASGDSILVASTWREAIPLNSLNEAVYFQVQALDQRYNGSPLSVPLRLSRPDSIPPTAPLFVRYAVGEGGTVLVWANSSSRDVTRHLLLRRTVSAPAVDWQIVRIFTGGDTTYADGSVQAATKYQYVLLAQDKSQNVSDSSASVLLTTPASLGLKKPLLAVLNAVQAAGQPVIALTWSYDAPDVSDYQLYRRVGRKSSGLWRIVSGGERTTTDDQVMADTSYQYSLRASFRDGTVSNWQSTTIVYRSIPTGAAGNQPPYVALPLPDLTANAGEPFSVTIGSATFADADDGIGSIQILPVGIPTGMTVTGSALQGVPTQAGRYTITVKAVDNRGASVSTAFVVLINDAPALVSTLLSQTYSIGQSFTYTVPASSFYDYGNGATQVNILTTGLPAGLVTSGATLAGKLNTTGPFVVTVQATDAKGASRLGTFLLFGDRPPLVTNLINTQTATVGLTYNWSIPTTTFNDPEGKPLLIQLRAATLPNGVSIQGQRLTGTPTATGSYTFVATATDVLGAIATTTFVLAINRSPNQVPIVASVPVGLTSLVGTTLTFSLPEGTFYDPDGAISSVTAVGGLPAGLSFSAATLSGTPTVAGSYTLVFQANDNDGATARLNWPLLLLSGNQLPIVQTAVPSLTATVGQSFTYTVPFATFADPDGSIASVNIITAAPAGLATVGNKLSGTPTQAGLYSLWVEATDNSDDKIGTLLGLTVLNQPVAPVLAGTTTICAGQSVSLTATNCAGQLTWTGGGTGNPLVVSPTVTTLYSATCSVGLVAALSSVTVTVNSLAVATIVGALSICAGQSTVLSASGGSMYRWSTGVTTSAISASAGGTYSVTVTSASGCLGVASTTVVVNPLPTASIGGTLSVCTGQATALTANGGSGYQWSTGATTAMISVTTAGPYSVTVTGAGGCSALASTAVIANPVPVASIAGNVSVCAGQTTTLTASGGSAYRWSTGATTPAVAVNSAGIYSVTVSNGAGCSAVATANVVVNASATAVITGNLTICAGQSTELVVSGVPSRAFIGALYRWSSGETVPRVTASTAGPYSVTVIGATGCVSVAAVQVIVNALPTVGISGNLSVCAGQTTTLTASGGSAYRWSTGATTPAVAVNSAGIYNVTVSNGTGCSAVASVTTVVNPLPIASISGNLTICAGQSTALSASEGSSYQWSTGATTPAITASSAGPYSVTVTSGAGCSLVTTTSVTVNPLPVAGIGGNLSICTGQTTTLTASGGNTYRWSTGATTASVTIGTAGAYSVTVTNGAGCSAVAAVSVIVSALPVVSIAGTLSICSGQITTLTASGGSTYRWNTGALTSSISTSLAGTYSVTATSGVGCSAVTSAGVSVISPVVPSVVASSLSIAAGQSVTLTASGCGGSVAWSTGAVGNVLVVSPALSTTYTAQCTIGSCSSLSTVPVLITVNRAPVVQTAVANQTAIVGQAYSYTIPATTFIDPDGQALLLTLSGLPPGLSFSGGTRVISGTPTAVGSSTLTVTATDPGNLSVTTRFVLAVTPVPVFAITGVTMVSCQTVGTNLRAININPLYTGLTGQPVSFSIDALMVPTTNPGPYTLNIYIDSPNITLRAVQNGVSSSFGYNWLNVCNSGSAPNQPPTVANVITPRSATFGQSFTYAIPANTFADDAGANTLSLSMSGLPAGLFFDAGTKTIGGTPTTAGSFTATLTATDLGNLSVTTRFVIVVNQPSIFTLTGVTMVNCQIAGTNLRTITINPQYAATNGQSIAFSIDGLTLPTTNPGPYSVSIYTDSPNITLRAVQSGVTSTFGYNWRAVCPQ